MSLVAYVQSQVAVGSALLADYTLVLKSPPGQTNTLRMEDGSTLSVVLAAPANVSDSQITLEGVGSIGLSGTLRAETLLTIGTDTVAVVDETYTRFGKLTVSVTPAIGTAYTAGESVSFSQSVVSDIPANTISIDKAPQNVYTSKLPEFGFVIAKSVLPIRPRDGWTVTATNTISNEVLSGTIGNVTGGTANVFVWVGSP